MADEIVSPVVTKGYVWHDEDRIQLREWETNEIHLSVSKKFLEENPKVQAIFDEYQLDLADKISDVKAAFETIRNVIAFLPTSSKLKFVDKELISAEENVVLRMSAFDPKLAVPVTV